MSSKAPNPAHCVQSEAGPSTTAMGQQSPTGTSLPRSPSQVHGTGPDRRHDSAVTSAWQDLSLADDLPVTNAELARKSSLDFCSATIPDRPVTWQAPRWSCNSGGGSDGDGVAGPSRPRSRLASPEVAEPADGHDVARKDSFSMVLDLAQELELAAEPLTSRQPTYPLPGPLRRPRPSHGRQQVGAGSQIELPTLDVSSGKRPASGPRMPPQARLSR